MNNKRLLSLDALRGFDMFWIMSGDRLIHALAKATNWPVLLWLSEQMNHTVWNGCTAYDMIFPLFLFIAGVSMPFSLKKQQPVDKRKIYLSMFRRTVILIILGMIVNGLLKFNGLENTRLPSVLGRIGLAWFFAGLIFLNTGTRAQIYWFIGILLGYWAAMMWGPVPGYGLGVLRMDGSLESYLDRVLIPGRLHDGVHDPEGFLSTIPAISTALLGMLTGTFLLKQEYSMHKKTYCMIGVGILLMLSGLLWNMVFPINKRLWSSSFVVYVGGFSLILFAVFYFIIDVLKFPRWAFPFMIIGMNSIVIYMASEGIIDFSHTANFIFGGLIHHTSEIWQPVFSIISVIIIQLGLLYFLYRNKLFLKV